MTAQALLLGSIGVLAETSEIQRRAFNTAFEMNELVWHWDRETYGILLEVPGGKARINYFARAQGVDVDIEQIYEDKVAVFDHALRNTRVAPRPGITALIADASHAGLKIGLASSTDPRQVAIILHALRHELDASVFDFIGDRTQVDQVKPHPEIYRLALAALSVKAQDAIALEDTPESAAAAVSAGIRTIAYPGDASRHRVLDFEVSTVVQPRLTDLDMVALA